MLRATRTRLTAGTVCTAAVRRYGCLLLRLRERRSLVAYAEFRSLLLAARPAVRRLPSPAIFILERAAERVRREIITTITIIKNNYYLLLSGLGSRVILADFDEPKRACACSISRRACSTHLLKRLSPRPPPGHKNLTKTLSNYRDESNPWDSAWASITTTSFYCQTSFTVYRCWE